MRFLSVCSGIEAASVAWNPLGWHAAAFSEIEPFPCAVLTHHYPDVPNRGDMTKFESWPDDAIDLLCGGTPCQSFSVAGLRKGLADPRGNLMLTYGAIAARHRPRWLVWENVPGVLSSNGGRDFGTFLGMLGQLGYGFAYRVLDAQFFGVAQRRRRVFVVGCLGDWRRAAAVLFERHCLSGHPAPRREARAGTAVGALAGTSPGGGWRVGADEAAAGQLIPSTGDISHCLSAGGMGRIDYESETFVTHAPEVAATMIARSSRGGGQTNSPGHNADEELVVHASGWHQRYCEHTHAGCSEGCAAGPCRRDNPAIAFDTYNQAVTGETTQTLCSRGDSPGGNSHLVPAVQTAMQVRRLTPRECERLQGFPDDYTAVPHRGKLAADGPRYKALGNSWAVPCARWIGQRIEAVEAITAIREAA